MKRTTEKLSQAKRLVADSAADAWLVFVRETAKGSDPCLPLILHGDLTWQSALIVDSRGKTTAIVGNFDADPIVESGDWDAVKPYVEGIGPALIETLEDSVSPGGKIAVNFSVSDDKADGLTHGMWLALEDLLKGTRFEASLVSAEPIVGALRAQKTPAELQLVREAIAEGDILFGFIERFAKVGITEREVFDHVHAVMAERSLGFAWGETGDPIVNSGPASMIGHGVPSSTIRISPGHVFHIDLGVRKSGYCSDVQRCWFVGDSVPEDVTKALNAVNAAITAGAATLKPGVQGYLVDQAARESIVASGYEEYRHALGHQVGMLAHDGGTILAPRWARYGTTPFGEVREGEVYTLELGVMVPGRGYLGIEEMAVVTANGCEFLTVRQTAMPMIQSSAS